MYKDWWLALKSGFAWIKLFGDIVRNWEIFRWMKYTRHNSRVNGGGSLSISYFVLTGIDYLSEVIWRSGSVLFRGFLNTWVDPKNFKVEFKVVNVKVVAVEGDWNSDEGKYALGEVLIELWFESGWGPFSKGGRVNSKTSELIDLLGKNGGI